MIGVATIGGREREMVFVPTGRLVGTNCETATTRPVLISVPVSRGIDASALPFAQKVTVPVSPPTAWALPASAAALRVTGDPDCTGVTVG
jgi:hypothetical protein